MSDEPLISMDRRSSVQIIRHEGNVLRVRGPVQADETCQTADYLLVGENYEKLAGTDQRWRYVEADGVGALIGPIDSLSNDGETA